MSLSGNGWTETDKLPTIYIGNLSDKKAGTSRRRCHGSPMLSGLLAGAVLWGWRLVVGLVENSSPSAKFHSKDHLWPLIATTRACSEYHGKRGRVGQAASGPNGGVPHDGGAVLVRSDLANVFSIICGCREVARAFCAVFAEVPTRMSPRV